MSHEGQNLIDHLPLFNSLLSNDLFSFLDGKPSTPANDSTLNERSQNALLFWTNIHKAPSYWPVRNDAAFIGLLLSFGKTFRARRVQRGGRWVAGRVGERSRT